MHKKILYLRTDITYTEIVAGGAVSHTTGVIGGFKQLGYEVVCAAASLLSVLKDHNLAELQVLHNPRSLKWLKWRINCLLSNIFFTWQAYQLSKKHTFEYIYQRYSPLNCTGVLLARLINVSLLLEYNGSEVWMDSQWSKKRWFSGMRIMNWFELYNMRHAHRIVVVSQALKDELVARGICAHKILVNPNGVNADAFDPARLAEERAVVRKKLAIENSFVIGFVGTFAPWHGIDTISAIIPAVMQQLPNAHFLLIGDGPLLPAFKKEVLHAHGAHVTCTGLLAHGLTQQYMAACDLFVSPTKPNADGSRFFGSPTKLFEYMSLSKPVIASDLEQLAQVVHPAVRSTMTSIDTEVGVLVFPGNVHDFVTAIIACAHASEQVRIKIGNNAREKVLREYTWDNHVRKIVEFASW